MLADIGRVCIKTTGHEAQQKCVVVDTGKDNFVIVAGPRVKKRRCNIFHLELLPHTVNIKKGASESEAAEALLSAGIISKADFAGKPAGYTPKPSAPAVQKKAEPKAASKEASKKEPKAEIKKSAKPKEAKPAVMK